MTTIYTCTACQNQGQRGSKYFKKLGNEVACLSCENSSNVHILQQENYEEDLCENKCENLFDCCDCGGNNCGCSYCWSCNACENCQNENSI